VINQKSQRITEWVARIDERIPGKTISYSRPLESGPAAGTSCWILQSGSQQTVTLFSLSEGPDEEIIADIIVHAGSAGSSATVLTSPDGDQVFFSKEADNRFAWLNDLCVSSGKFSGQTREDQIRISDPVETLVQYLTELRKELNSWLYHRDGETSESTRELTIQTLINHIILKRMLHVHERPKTEVRVTLTDTLCSFASTMPVLDAYDVHARNPDEETTQMVESLAISPARLLKDVRLSWIEPERWSAAFTRYLAAIPRKSYRKRHSSDGEEDRREVLLSGAGRLVAKVLAAEEDLFRSGKFCDPAGGCGELIALVLRNMRTNLIRDMRDTITGRLIAAGEMVHATDASPIHIAVIRFVIVCWILSGECDDPSLNRTPLWYPFLSLNKQIRTGSPLYDERALEEFVSVQEGYPTLRYLHPLKTGELAPGIRPFSFIISCPERKTPSGPPEVACYLTRRFTSYSGGTDQGTLYAELAGKLLAPGGVCIIFLRKNWLSESSYQGFRQWVTHSPPITLVIPEDGPCLNNVDDLSVVILRTGEKQVHTVIRFAPGKDGGILTRKYQIFPAKQHKDDGWRLQDPWEETMMEQLCQGTMPLSEYLFDELYPGTESDTIGCNADHWISLVRQGSELIVRAGPVPEPDADIIIPGDDQYLTAILHSSLVRWYIKISIRNISHPSPDLMNLIRNLPVRAIDHYSSEDQQALEGIITMESRIAMLERRREVCHAWHDLNRIDRQIKRAEEEIDRWICILYEISSDDCIWIRQQLEDTCTESTSQGFEIG
jgi:hypothetical protein